VICDPNQKLLDNFVTSTQWEELRINCENLLFATLFFAQNLPDSPFVPWLLGSEQNEDLHRSLRSLGDDVRVDPLRMLQLVGVVSRHHEIVATFSEWLNYSEMSRHSRRLQTEGMAIVGKS